jgi:hypothetical protein
MFYLKVAQTMIIMTCKHMVQLAKLGYNSNKMSFTISQVYNMSSRLYMSTMQCTTTNMLQTLLQGTKTIHYIYRMLHSLLAD